MSVSFRPFLAGDVVQLQLQPSQHVTLGVTRPVMGIDDGRELEECSVGAWTAIGPAGRILCCSGFRMLWPAGPRTNGHAVAWAMLAAGKGAAMLAITRFLKRVVADSPLTRIEAITRAGCPAEGRWLRQLGFSHVADMAAWGPDGDTHALFERVRPFVGGSASPQPGQPGDAETAHPRLREEA